jgi:hypothetical protein
MPAGWLPAEIGILAAEVGGQPEHGLGEVAGTLAAFRERDNVETLHVLTKHRKTDLSQYFSGGFGHKYVMVNCPEPGVVEGPFPKFFRRLGSWIARQIMERKNFIEVRQIGFRDA